jgi:hypothetical protein
VADELERSAGRAQARGGVAAAAAFLERATELTPDPTRRSVRALAAAQAMLRAGAFDPALALLSTAEEGSLEDLPRARIDLLRAQLEKRISRRTPRSCSPVAWPTTWDWRRSRRPPDACRRRRSAPARAICCSMA